METEINKITNLIIGEAEEKASIIIKEAQEQSEVIVDEKKRKALQEVEVESSRLMSRLDNAVLLKRRIIADARLKANWRVLEERQKILDEVLSGLKVEFYNYANSDSYNEMLNKLIVTAGTLLKGGKLKVTLNEKDVSKVNLDELVERISTETGIETSLALSDERHEDFGAIVQTSEGDIVVDNLFSSILGRMEIQLRSKAVKILFS